jgi:hypothetical protein
MGRRLTFLLCVACLAGAGVALGAPGGNGNGNGPPEDVVVGSGKITFPASDPFPEVTEQYVVSAHSSPAGDDPQGQITVHSPLAESNEEKADVTCMTVTGNLAHVGGTFEHPFQYGQFQIRWWEVIIQDNGPPGQAADAVNSFAFIDRPRPPGFSPCNFDAPPDFPVGEGNYDVYDAPTGRIVP